MTPTANPRGTNRTEQNDLTMLSISEFRWESIVGIVTITKIIAILYSGMFDNSFVCLKYTNNDAANRTIKEIRLPGNGSMPSFEATILYI